MGNYFSGTLKWNKQFFRTSSRSNKIQIPRTPLRTRHTWGSVTQHIYNVYLCFVFIDLFVWKTQNIEISWHLTGKTWHSSGFQMSLFACFFCANLFNRWLFKFLGILGEDTRVCARDWEETGLEARQRVGWVEHRHPESQFVSTFKKVFLSHKAFDYIFFLELVWIKSSLCRFVCQLHSSRSTVTHIWAQPREPFFRFKLLKSKSISPQNWFS